MTTSRYSSWYSLQILVSDAVLWRRDCFVFANNRATPPSIPVMATDEVDKYERGRETFGQLEALRASTATKGGASLTPEVKSRSTETSLGAVCHCNGVFISSFFGVVFFLDGGRVGVKVARCPQT